MEEGSNISLMPFAKQSKMVSRYKLEEEPDMASADCSHSDFWDRLIQQQSSHWMEEYHEAPSLLMSGYVAQRPAEAGGPFPWQVISTEQKLQSPKELCRRKKKGAKPERREKGGVLSVCYHLEELKRRQSSIDELKKGKWGGRLPQLLHEGENSAAGPHHGVPLSPFSMPRSAAQLFKKEEDPVFQRHSREQLLYPEWNSGTREQKRISPESPAFSFTTATLDRYPVVATCEPEEDFGGFQFHSEE